MWTRIKRVLSNKNIMLRIAFTLLILLVVRILSHTTVPLVETSSVVDYIKNSSYFAILNNFSGQSLENLSIMSLGITPYITASIAVQLLQMVIPTLKEWSEQGEVGKQKLNKVTRYMAIILAFIQGLALILGLSTRGSLIVTSLEGSIVDRYRYFFYVYMAFVMAAGSALAMWFASLITKRGVGNGSSILIVAGIVTSLPTMVTTLWSKYITNAGGWWWFIIIILLYFGILFGVVYMQIATRKVPIQYANRQQNKADSNIPLKLNAGGVIPVIFAQTIMSIPLSIVGAINTSGNASDWINNIFSTNEPIGFILYVILIVIFAFFYAFLTVNPQKISDNLSKSNAYVPGVRPGIDTQDYVASLLFKVTVLGTAYLTILAILPIVTSLIFNFTTAEARAVRIGGTSLLIIVGVAIETTQQVETDANQDDYGSIFR